MIVATSALIAILRDEPEAETIAAALAAAQAPRISAANYLETAIVIDASRDPIASRHVDDLFTKARLVIEPVTAEQAVIARAAYRDFGKGSGHPAQLNFGDCFAYALAKSAGEPLLFKGEDWAEHVDRRSDRANRNRDRGDQRLELFTDRHALIREFCGL